MEPQVYNYFLERLEAKKQCVKGKMDSIVEELFGNLITEFNALAQTNGKEKDPSAAAVDSTRPMSPVPKVGNCIEDINTKIHYMLLTTYEEAFNDYEQSLEFAKAAKQQQQNALNGEVLFETTPVKKRKRKKRVEPDDRALILMDKRPKTVPKSFYCKWPACGHSSKNFYNLAKHVRHNHFNLPVTKQEQDELNIVDKRDPLKFVGELTSANPNREVVQPTEEDLYQPEYSRRRKYLCKYLNCGRTFNEKQVLVSHEKLHLGLKPFKCKFEINCPFSSLKRTAVRRHIRQKHFKLPKTLKKQAAMNIVDPRDPDMFIEEDQAQLSML